MEGVCAPDEGGTLERILGIRSGEERRVGVLFLSLLLASGIFILGRTARDTLFLSHFTDPSRLLPWMFVLYGAVSAVVAFFFGRWADRFARPKLIAATAVVGAATWVVFWFLVRAGLGWAIAAFYVWSEVVVNLLVIELWTFAGDLFDPRALKRIGGLVGSARILGIVVFGLAGAAAVRDIGTEQILLVAAFLILAVGALPRLLGTEGTDRTEAVRPRPARLARPAPAILSDPFVRALGAFLLVTFVLLTIGDYEFKVIARRVHDRESLAHFFGLFYATAGTVGFVFQLLATRRILARFGASAGLAVLPSLFGGASAILLVSPGLAMASVMKFADNGLQFTIHETSLQSLYVPISERVKARVRTLLEAAIKPMAYGVGGLVLVLLAPRFGVAGVEKLGFVTVALLVPWLALVPLIRKRYLAALERSMARADFATAEVGGGIDGTGHRLLLAALAAPDPTGGLRALDAFGDADTPDVRKALLVLAAHPDLAVRARVIRRLARLGEDAALPPILAALADPEPSVREAAAAAAFALGGDEVVEAVLPLATDADRKVRIEAIAGLFRAGGVEGRLAAAPLLASLLGNPEPEPRKEGVEILRRLGKDAFRPLRALLADADPGVRRRALRAAEAVADPRLAPLLLLRLDEHSSRAAAADALVAIGKPAVPLLAARLVDPGTKRNVRVILPRILRAIATPESVAALRAAEDFPDSHVRLRVYSALGRLRAELHLPPRPIGEIEPRLRAEIAEALRLHAGRILVAESWPSPEIDRSFVFRIRRAERRILRLLEQRVDRHDLDLVRRNLRDEGHRARATELLDGLLDPQLRSLVLPMFDSSPPHEKIRSLEELVGSVSLGSPIEFLRGECRHPRPYIRFLWLNLVREYAIGEALPETQVSLADQQPLVREAAARALARLLPADRLGPALAPLLSDPDPKVLAIARRLAAEPEAPMIATVEKILFLENVPLFEKLSGEDLSPLARAAEVVEIPAGQLVFEQGEPADALYVVMHGAISIETGGASLATIGEREAFGELAVLDGSPRAASARAKGETALLRIGIEDFREILHEQSELAEGIILVLAQRIREADRRFEAERRAKG
jgi:HEAT repeat protein/ATP/ADP translocase